MGERICLIYTKPLRVRATLIRRGVTVRTNAQACVWVVLARLAGLCSAPVELVVPLPTPFSEKRLVSRPL